MLFVILVTAAIGLGAARGARGQNVGIPGLAIGMTIIAAATAASMAYFTGHTIVPRMFMGAATTAVVFSISRLFMK